MQQVLKKLMRWEIILAFIPAASGYALSSACDMPPSNDVPFRPPPWVFASLWPVLYLLLGAAWFLTATDRGVISFQSLTYLLTVVALNCWLVVYSCLRQKKNGVFVLLATVLCVAYNILVSGSAERAMLIPLAVWVSFATLMNAWQTATEARSETENIKKHISGMMSFHDSFR